jgi:hypothetical protein
MKEYKIIKPESIWTYKDETFEDLLNKYASQGWEVKSVGYGETGNILKVVLERAKNR